jgi:RimJ/RimL family protein N-acetyltransferase
MSGPGTRLETPRLIIRSYEPRDAGPWVAMLSDPEVRRYLPPFPLPTTEAFHGGIQRRHALERERGYAMRAVEVKDTETFIGQSGLNLIGDGPEVEIAYHFSRISWHQGYATEAAAAVLEHAFGPAGLDRVIGLVVPENVGSWRVLERAGMRYEGLADYFGLTGLRKYAATADERRISGEDPGRQSDRNPPR